MIKIIDKHKAKFIVEVGTGKNRARKTKTVYYEKKRDLQKMYFDFEQETKEKPPSEMTVKELVDAYIEHCRVVGLKETTLLGYRVASDRLQSLTDGFLAKDLTTYHLDKIVAQMAQNGVGEKKKTYSAKTIANTLGLLSSSYDRAIKLGILKTNPCTHVSRPKRDAKTILAFNEEEVAAFLKALGDERLDFKVGYELCLFCGMRKGEVLGLRESDINFDAGCLSINKTRNYVNGKNVEQSPKTAKSRRTLAVPKFVLDDAAALIKDHHEADFFCCDYLIQNGFGDVMQSATFSNHIKRIEKRCGISQVTVHGLRHTFATLLNASGFDMAQISAELGHANITTTSNLYVHVFGGTTASSRSIAQAVNNRFERVP